MLTRPHQCNHELLMIYHPIWGIHEYGPTINLYSSLLRICDLFLSREQSRPAGSMIATHAKYKLYAWMRAQHNFMWLIYWHMDKSQEWGISGTTPQVIKIYGRSIPFWPCFWAIPTQYLLHCIQLDSTRLLGIALCAHHFQNPNPGIPCLEDVKEAASQNLLMAKEYRRVHWNKNFLKLYNYTYNSNMGLNKWLLKKKHCIYIQSSCAGHRHYHQSCPEPQSPSSFWLTICCDKVTLAHLWSSTSSGHRSLCFSHEADCHGG